MAEIRFAVIGAGNIGKVHAQAIAALPNARLTVICDRSGTRARALAEQYDIDWCQEPVEAVQRLDVDAVCVATPSGTHAEIAEAAAAAGKHLFVEKPLDVTLPRADRIIAAAARAGVKLAGVFPSRFKLGPAAAREAILQGRLGRLTLCDAYVKWHRPDSYYDGTWRGTFALDGGGALINQAIHSVDLLQWLAGPVESVFARTATLAHGIEGEDAATAVLQFAGGALGVIQAATSCWPGDPARIELRGSRGTIVLTEGMISTWKLADAGTGEEEAMLALENRSASGAANPTAIGYEMHRRQLADLVAAIVEDRRPAVDGCDARSALELVLAIYRSARIGAPVSLPLE